MLGHKLRGVLFQQKTALLRSCLAAIAVGLLAPAMCAQQADAKREVNLGIIVAGTAQDAENLLKQLETGIDFGGWQKKSPSIPARATADM